MAIAPIGGGSKGASGAIEARVGPMMELARLTLYASLVVVLEKKQTECGQSKE